MNKKYNTNIEGTILCEFNGVVLSQRHNDGSYCTHKVDPDGKGLSFGNYFSNKEDAQQDFVLRSELLTSLRIPVSSGTLVVTPQLVEDYPAVLIDLRRDTGVGEEEYDIPLATVEQPKEDDAPRVLVYQNTFDDDYSHCINFEL